MNCPECGTEILGGVNFCPNCGAKIKASKKTEKSKDSGFSRTALTAIGTTFVFSIIVILMILNSNRKKLETKVFLNSQKQSQSQSEMPANHPDMEKMRHIQEVKDQLKADPNNTELMVHLANNYFDIGRFDLAAIYYKQAVEHQVNRPEVLIDLGVSYFNLSKLDSALIFVNKALQKDPNHRLGLFNKGVIQYNMRQFAEAIATWDKLIRVHPESEEANTAKQFIVEAKKLLNK